MYSCSFVHECATMHPLLCVCGGDRGEMDGVLQHFLSYSIQLDRMYWRVWNTTCLRMQSTQQGGLHLTAIPPKLTPPLWLAHIVCRWLTIGTNLLTPSIVFLVGRPVSIHFTLLPFSGFQHLRPAKPARLPYCSECKVIRLIWGWKQMI